MRSCTKSTGKNHDKRAACGMNIKDESNSGCDLPMLWQVYGKMVGSELTALNAPYVSGK